MVATDRATRTHIAIFKFTLGEGQSIGPSQLQALWARACQSHDVSVGRSRGVGTNGKPTYSLYASQHLNGLPQLEKRLRLLFEEYQLRASLIVLHAH